MIFHPVISLNLWPQKRNKRDGKITPTQNLHVVRFNCTTLATKVSTPMKTDDSLSKIAFQDMCASKHTLSVPHSSRTHNSPWKFAEIKNTLMHMTTYFSASRPKSYLTFFWMHRRATYKHFQKTFPQNVGSDCTFVYIDGLMQSVLYRKSKHNASQWLRSLQPYHTSKLCHIVFCLKILVVSVGYPTILLKFTLPCYKVKLCPIKTHCWHISCLITLPSLTIS